MFFFDPLYFLLIAPALLLSVGAQIWVKSAFSPDEMPGARRVLGAAAMTYVAAAVAAVMQLVHFLLRSGLLGGNRDE